MQQLIAILSLQFISSRLARVPVVQRLSSSMPVFEVEEKFSLTNRNRDQLETRLRNLGFSTSCSVHMIDWYYDNADFDLTRRDCWLRCRETVGDPDSRQWQLKRRAITRDARSAAVYEEIEGHRAIDDVSAILMKHRKSGTEAMKKTLLTISLPSQDAASDNTPIPSMPISELAVFAKIMTQRSSWKASCGPFQQLTVDLDMTDYGYAVGEVEAVVAESDQIEAARTLVRKLVQAMDVSSPSDEASGKMECFLKRYRPDVYRICVESGVI
jgi:thiamine-triphosphatase